MKQLLSFSKALSDPMRVRLVALAMAHKITSAELASVLKVAPTTVAQMLTELASASLLKAEQGSEFVRLKRRHLVALETLFTYFSVTVKKDATLRSDAKLAKTLREARHREKKNKAKKSAGKPSSTGVKPVAESSVKTEPKPESKAKSKSKAKAKAKVKEPKKAKTNPPKVVVKKR